MILALCELHRIGRVQSVRRVLSQGEPSDASLGRLQATVADEAGPAASGHSILAANWRGVHRADSTSRVWRAADHGTQRHQ